MIGTTSVLGKTKVDMQNDIKLVVGYCGDSDFIPEISSVS